jgi:hypothetical protein
VDKEYGKLTADQFRQLIGTLPELRQQRGEVARLLAEAPKEKLAPFSWAASIGLIFTSIRSLSTSRLQ